MKNGIRILSVLLIMVFSNTLSAQFSFGISPGSNINGAYFGYKINKIVPYVGFQYFNVGYTGSTTGKRTNYTTNQIDDYTDDFSIRQGFMIPSFGVKYFIISQNRINAYANILIAKPIVFGELIVDDVPNEDFNNQIENLNLWAGGLGFGVEYNFSDNFSIGGEYGIRYLTSTNSFEGYERTIYDPVTNDPITYRQKISGTFNFSPTYTKITLNYYFDKKKEE